MPKRQGHRGAFIKDNFSTIWPVHLDAFTRLLTQLRTRFDGDLELMLVLVVIGERTRPSDWTPELLTYRQLTRRPEDGHLQYPINIQSVSDFSGIPRETVRRKVGILERKGWVARDKDGKLSVSSAAAQDLEDATRESITYLETLFEIFERTSKV
jgi:predicted transcriptional regulator